MGRSGMFEEADGHHRASLPTTITPALAYGPQGPKGDTCQAYSCDEESLEDRPLGVYPLILMIPEPLECAGLYKQDRQRLQAEMHVDFEVTPTCIRYKSSKISECCSKAERCTKGRKVRRSWKVVPCVLGLKDLPYSVSEGIFSNSGHQLPPFGVHHSGLNHLRCRTQSLQVDHFPVVGLYDNRTRRFGVLEDEPKIRQHPQQDLHSVARMRRAHLW